MLIKSHNSTAVIVFASLFLTSLTSISCGSSETKAKQSESEESAAFLPAVWYSIVVVSTGLTIRSNIRSHSKCMAIRQQMISEHPQYAGNLRCKSSNI